MNTKLYQTEVQEVQRLAEELKEIEARFVMPSVEIKSKDFMAIGGIIISLVVATVVFLTLWMVK
jgi:hypothetical protein